MDKLNDGLSGMKSLSWRLKTLRQAANLEPYELADRAGIPRSTISKIERGDQSSLRADTAARLASILGCEIGDLIGVPVPRAREALDAEHAGLRLGSYEIANMDRMLREYLTSQWLQSDAPSPEELQWLASLAGIAFPRGGPAPGAEEVHDLLGMRRGNRT